MKRLMKVIVMLAAMLIAAAPAFAQSKDLAGSWVLDVEKTGKKDGPPAVVITLTDKEFSAQIGGESAPSIVLKLDGTESVLKTGQKAKASWNGNKLEATMLEGRGGPETLIFSRDGSWLLVEGKSEDDKPMKFYYKKAPAKPAKL